MRRINCYWYHEIQDMNAKVPTCMYYGEYDKCPCSAMCKYYISKLDVDSIIRELKGGDSE